MLPGFKAWLSDASRTLHLCTWIAAASLVLITLQWLWNWRAFREQGTLSWQLLRQGRRFTREGTLAHVGQALLGFPGFLFVLSVRIAAAFLLLIWPAETDLRPWALTLIVLASLLVHFRNFPYGFSGADRMLLVIFGALWISQLAPTDPAVQKTCLWFIALQVTLSYVTSGICKLSSADWRAGKGLYYVYTDPFLVAKPVASFLHRHPLAVRFFEWNGALWQNAFPLVFVVGWPRCWLFLLWGLGFHLLNALILGLNNFLFVYLAAYPAILYCVLQMEWVLHRS